MTDTATATKPRVIPRGDLAISVGVVVMGLIAAWQTTLIQTSAYAQVGPRAFAWATSCMLIVMGLFLVKDAVMGGWSHETEEFGEVDWQGGLWMVGGLIVNVALIEFIGFILASTLLFIFTARAFGSLSLVRDTLIGLTLTIVAYVGFDRVLGYKIGTGWIESLI
jgi:putative tricarboxylic transport membrane protein